MLRSPRTLFITISSFIPLPYYHHHHLSSPLTLLTAAHTPLPSLNTFLHLPSHRRYLLSRFTLPLPFLLSFILFPLLHSLSPPFAITQLIPLTSISLRRYKNIYYIFTSARKKLTLLVISSFLSLLLSFHSFLVLNNYNLPDYSML